MPTYRTPDVYIEEISVFPPSVAEVETAIPAFVGYTEKVGLITADDLKNVPRRIKSLLEYESYYGKGPVYAVTAAHIDEAGNFLSAEIGNSYISTTACGSSTTTVAATATSSRSAPTSRPARQSTATN